MFLVIGVGIIVNKGQWGTAGTSNIRVGFKSDFAVQRTDGKRELHLVVDFRGNGAEESTGGYYIHSL